MVIGKGGREHALCWKLKQSPRVTAVYCAPGNAGTALDAQNVAIEPNDQRGLAQFAKREGIGLTVVGPEEPLAKGLVDLFQREGLRVFGPRRDSAELEGSKVFAKDLMRQAGIPTADYRIFRSAPDAEHYILSREVALIVRSRGRSMIRNTIHCRTAAETLEAVERILDPREMLGPGVQVEIEDRGVRKVFGTLAEAREYVLNCPLGIVVKADGLAAGKGVYVCSTLRQAIDALDQIMVRRIYGQAGDRVLIEERLDGRETSVLAFTDGRTIVPLASSQDYKRALDGDEGPNTGGMGAFSPTPMVTPELMQEVEREVLVPIVHALKRARRPFRGILYAGLMLTNQGPKVLEFNVRFGDPETQVILMRLKSDLLDVLEAVVDERLDTVALEWDPRPAVTVVMASEGYPGHYEHNRWIQHVAAADRLPDVKVFHAGTKLRPDPEAGREPRIVSDGGRVLNVTALGDDLAQARERAYEAVRTIRFPGGFYRRDIAENVGEGGGGRPGPAVTS
nr:phosphoribosylamine--glycine ligase [Paludisphaera mucosa]